MIADNTIMQFMNTFKWISEKFKTITFTPTV